MKIGDYAFTIFRAYKDFYNLHENMKKEFSKQLPQFPHKIYLRRSEVKSVAKQRASDLDSYLQVRITLQLRYHENRVILYYIINLRYMIVIRITQIFCYPTNILSNAKMK